MAVPKTTETNSCVQTLQTKPTQVIPSLYHFFIQDIVLQANIMTLLGTAMCSKKDVKI